MNAPTTLILSGGVTVQDLMRALTHSRLAVSNTIAPHLFVIKPSTRLLPDNVVELPALLRPQCGPLHD